MLVWNKGGHVVSVDLPQEKSQENRSRDSARPSRTLCNTYPDFSRFLGTSKNKHPVCTSCYLSFTFSSKLLVLYTNQKYPTDSNNQNAKYFIHPFPHIIWYDKCRQRFEINQILRIIEMLPVRMKLTMNFRNWQWAEILSSQLGHSLEIDSHLVPVGRSRPHRRLPARNYLVAP